MATRGCTTPYREGSPSTRGPPTTQREVTGACPIPPAPKVPGRGESTDRKPGARWEPILPLPPIPTHDCTKPGPKPKQMPRYQERRCRESSYTAPLERPFTCPRNRSKPAPRGTERSRGRGLGASEGGSEPPLRPPGAPLPRSGAGPLSRTWSPPGHRARHTPSPPTVARPRGGLAGSAPSPPPRGRGHDTLGSTGCRRPPKARKPASQTVSWDLEHALSPPYVRDPSAPIRPFGAPSPRRGHKTSTPKPPPTPGGAPGAHLHDAVRGLGCRHLHPHLLLLLPPRPPPFSALPRDRLIPEGPRPAHHDPARRSHWQWRRPV